MERRQFLSAAATGAAGLFAAGHLLSALAGVTAAVLVAVLASPADAGNGTAMDEDTAIQVLGELISNTIVLLLGVMVGVLLCMSVVQLGLGAINVLWVPFMQRTFGLGPEGLGAVDVAQGVGMAAGGLLLGFVATRMRKKDLAGWSIVLAGVAIVLIGLSPALSLATWLTVQDGSGNGVEGLTIGTFSACSTPGRSPNSPRPSTTTAFPANSRLICSTSP